MCSAVVTKAAGSGRLFTEYRDIADRWAKYLSEFGADPDNQEFFNKTVDALWLNYNLSPTRVPLNDLFSSVTSLQIHFQHRSVQGGMFIRLLKDKKICLF